MTTGYSPVGADVKIEINKKIDAQVSLTDSCKCRDLYRNFSYWHYYRIITTYLILYYH